MVYEQTLEIPADRKLHLDLELPESFTAGKTVRLSLFEEGEVADAPRKSSAEIVRAMWDSLPTTEEIIAEAHNKGEERRKSAVDPLIEWRDSLNGEIFGVDGVAYQRSMRDEWPD